MDIKAVVNKPEFRACKDKAVPLIEAAYGPPPWWAGSWINDPKVEAVAFLLYTGALVPPGASGKPDLTVDRRLADVKAKLLAIADGI